MGDETPDIPEKQLFTVIPQKEVKGSGAFMGSAHVYDLGGLGKKSDVVQVAIDPNEVEELDADKIKKLFEQQNSVEKAEKTEDFSDMVAEHAAKQSKKRKKDSDTKSSKKSKDFKF